MTRIGFIGAGGILGNHVRGFKGLPGVELVGLYDIDEQHAKARAKEFGMKSFGSSEELIASVDAVVILTPPFARLEYVLAAAHEKKHILAEKPIAINLDEADEMIRATDQAGVIFMIGFNDRFRPGHALVKKLKDEGDLGEVVWAWDRLHMYRESGFWAQKRGNRDEWRLSMKRSGGRMNEFGSHKINWLHWLGGPVKSVYGKAATVAETLGEVDDTDVAVLNFERGAAQVEISLSPTVVGAQGVGVIGTEGGAEIKNDHVAFRKKNSADVEMLPLPTDVKTRHQHFIRCIEKGDKPIVDGREARHTLAICLAFLESVRTGQVCNVPA